MFVTAAIRDFFIYNTTGRLTKSYIIAYYRNNIMRIASRYAFLLLAIGFLITATFLGTYFVNKNKSMRSKAIVTSLPPQPLPSLSDWIPYQTLITQGAIAAPKPILEVSMLFKNSSLTTLSNSGPLTITRLRRLNGYISKFQQMQNTDLNISYGKHFTIQLVNGMGQTLKSVSFNPPALLRYDTVTTTNLTGGAALQPDVEFGANLPWDDTASIVRILDPNNVIIGQQSVKGLTSVSNLVNASCQSSGPGSPTGYANTTGSGTTTGFTSLNTSARAEIVFIGNNYNSDEMATFHQDVSRMSQALLNFEPWGTRSSQIHFCWVDNVGDNLGCHYNSNNVPVCNQSTIRSKLNGVDYDNVTVLMKNFPSGGYNGGSSSIFSFLRKEYALGYTYLYAHEIGHSFADLGDEYNAAGSGGTLDNQVHDYICYGGRSVPGEWRAKVAPVDLTQGCTYGNWYRSSPQSLMMGRGTINYYNTLSIERIHNVFHGMGIDPLSDPSPTINITSPFAGQNIITNTLAIQSRPRDNRSVTRVEYWLDGSIIKTTYVSPFDASVDITNVPNGVHNLEARAYDGWNRQGSNQVTFGIYHNGLPTPTPTPTIYATPTPVRCGTPYSACDVQTPCCSGYFCNTSRNPVVCDYFPSPTPPIYASPTPPVPTPTPCSLQGREAWRYCADPDSLQPPVSGQHIHRGVYDQYCIVQNIHTTTTCASPTATPKPVSQFCTSLRNLCDANCNGYGSCFQSGNQWCCPL